MPEKHRPKQPLPRMSAEAKARYERAVAEEMAARDENVAVARNVGKRLKDERKEIAGLVARLREARQQAGVSLNEMETRTGISKSSLSRLENSAGPNPTLLTLHRYAAAIGVAIEHRLVDQSPSQGTDLSGRTSRSAVAGGRHAS